MKNDILKIITRIVELLTIVLLLTWVAAMHQKVLIIESELIKVKEIAIKNAIFGSLTSETQVNAFIEINTLKSRIDKVEDILSITNTVHNDNPRLLLDIH